MMKVVRRGGPALMRWHNAVQYHCPNSVTIDATVRGSDIGTSQTTSSVKLTEQTILVELKMSASASANVPNDATPKIIPNMSQATI
ncbi:hypothetical protein V6N12_073601 [Hibiscus sabdariffa]|uniref:Uncharacterized protein n=1 Tax=Hibiscus sabdariffa TaxID=183260 RepID=A0ABR2A5I4_9ROSI